MKKRNAAILTVWTVTAKICFFVAVQSGALQARAQVREVSREATSAGNVAQSMVKEMTKAISSASDVEDRTAVVTQLKLKIDAMTPGERLALVNEFIKLTDNIQAHTLARMKVPDIANYVSMMAGIILLFHQPAHFKRLAMVWGGVLIAGGIYTKEKHLSRENVLTHAAQLRSELFALRNSVELQNRAGELN